MLKAVAVLALCLFAVSALHEHEYQSHFAKFVRDYDKSYARDEFYFRYNVFKKTLDKIHAANKDATAKFQLGLNEFADLTQEEFVATKLGLKGATTPFRDSKLRFEIPAGFKAASDFDWRSKGMVSPIKNQGQCGSCWAFSATGSMESAVAIAGRGMTTLSEQQLVDCSGSYGNMGCNGGLPVNAFEFIVANKGECSEQAYPYTGQDGSCKRGCQPVSTIKGYKNVYGEDGILAALAEQPVSIAIEADQTCFQYYSSGILTKDKCNCGSSLDHAVLAVGWGTEAGTDYWWVKNSWGTSWGDNGYVRLERGVGMCGIGQKWCSVPTA